MGFSHTSPMATPVLQHWCDQWASADAGIVKQDSPRASRPQAILKLRRLSSLDYKARHGSMTSKISIFLIPHIMTNIFDDLDEGHGEQARKLVFRMWLH